MKISITKENKENKKGTKVVKIVLCILFMLGVMFTIFTQWSNFTYGPVSGDQMLINLTSPTDGTDSGIYVSALTKALLPSVIITILFVLFVFLRFKIVLNFKNYSAIVYNEKIRKTFSVILSLAVFFGGLAYGINNFKLYDLYKAYFVKSSFIEENYVEPKETKLIFPEKKRNVIYIYLESMENSYMSKDLGGMEEINLIPKLTQLANEGYSFSDTDNKFGGPKTPVGSQWSLASMTNQMTGLPMKVPGDYNSYGSSGNFLPGAWTFGDVLNNEGYEQTVMVGANAKFGGLEYLFSSHGNYKVMDYNFAIENGLLPNNYKQFWGFEDDKLYKFAKDEITRLYNTGKPFNMTLETADTHTPGYVSPQIENVFNNQYANAIYYSQNEVYKFVQWIKQQPFYYNTTIILIGDHLSMCSDFFKNVNKNYNRTQYNLIINPSPELEISKTCFNNRIWSNYDMYPTVLAAMGVKIDGNRLALGTNLFSNEPTVFEQYGYDYVNKELAKKSVFFNDKILSPNGEKVSLRSSKENEKYE